VSGYYGGECQCDRAPGTILRTRMTVLGLRVGGNGHRGARAATESTKRIHCKECG
jgi:hypothetical protein